MNRNRMQMVIDAVAAHSPKKFDMKAWDCGTAQCAIGSFCIAHPRAKLHMKLRNAAYPIINNTALTGMDAVATYLEISYDDASHLFSSDTYNVPNPSKKIVLTRLRQYLATH